MDHPDAVARHQGPSYFILRTCDDGPSFSGPMTEDEVLKRITPNKHGETHYGPNPKFLKEVPSLDSSERALLIIRGEIIVPKVAEVVTKMTLP